MMSTQESHSSLCFPCCTPARVSAAVTPTDPLIFLLLHAISSSILVAPTSKVTVMDTESRCRLPLASRGSRWCSTRKSALPWARYLREWCSLILVLAFWLCSARCALPLASWILPCSTFCFPASLLGRLRLLLCSLAWATRKHSVSYCPSSCRYDHDHCQLCSCVNSTRPCSRTARTMASNSSPIITYAHLGASVGDGPCCSTLASI